MALYKKFYRFTFFFRSSMWSRLRIYAPELQVSVDRRSSGYIILPRMCTLSDMAQGVAQLKLVPAHVFQAISCSDLTKAYQPVYSSKQPVVPRPHHGRVSVIAVVDRRHPLPLFERPSLDEARVPQREEAGVYGVRQRQRQRGDDAIEGRRVVLGRAYDCS